MLGINATEAEIWITAITGIQIRLLPNHPKSKSNLQDFNTPVNINM